MIDSPFFYEPFFVVRQSPKAMDGSSVPRRYRRPFVSRSASREEFPLIVGPRTWTRRDGTSSLFKIEAIDVSHLITERKNVTVLSEKIIRIL